MYVIEPVTVTDAILTSSDIVEDDYAKYVAGTTYGDGNTIMVTDTGIHKIYESLLANNLNHYPPDNLTGATPWWLEISATNKWKAFDGKVGSQAIAYSYPSPSMSPSISPSLSPSASVSPSISPSASPSVSPSVSPSESPSLSPSASESPSESPSVSPSASPSE